MNIIAWVFVIAPLVIYVPLLCVEAWYSLTRLRGNEHLAEYIHVSWEMTHTLFIFGVNSFLWMWPNTLPVLAPFVFNPLMFLALSFIVRAVAYLFIYHSDISEREKFIYHASEYLFAASHLTIVASIVYVVVQVGMHMPNTPPHTLFLPYMIPGALLTIIVCCIPALRVYRVQVS